MSDTTGSARLAVGAAAAAAGGTFGDWSATATSAAKTLTRWASHVVPGQHDVSVDPNAEATSGAAAQPTVAENDADASWEKWLWTAGFFALDVALVFSMQLFVDSSATKRIRRLSSRKSRKGSSKGRDEDLDELLEIYFWKVLLAVFGACLCRCPDRFLDDRGFAYHLTTNVLVMLRCLSVVTFFIQDKMIVGESPES
mmetsp:Transcript_36369/g.77167  ORF Transcript_36369/g.77167 Transcript_36369/m.77167 type:complete len:198 (+) Transcript_36369:306-899(+)